MRDARTDSSSFRAALHELTTMLVYEAARTFPVEKYPVQTPVTGTEGTRAGQPAAAGPGAAGRLPRHDRRRPRCCPSRRDGLRRPRPRRAVSHEPQARTWSRCRATWPACRVLVLDPMLATGGSLEHCRRLLADRGCTDITALCVLAAPIGIARLEQSGSPLRLVTAAIDEGLNDNMFIVPGSATPATGSSAACPGSEPVTSPGTDLGGSARVGERTTATVSGHDWCCARRRAAAVGVRRRDGLATMPGSASTWGWPPLSWSSWPWPGGSPTPTGPRR